MYKGVNGVIMRYFKSGKGELKIKLLEYILVLDKQKIHNI